MQAELDSVKGQLVALAAASLQQVRDEVLSDDPGSSAGLSKQLLLSLPAVVTQYIQVDGVSWFLLGCLFAGCCH